MKFAHHLIATAVAAVMTTSALALTQPEYKAEKDRIAAEYKTNKQKCDGLEGNAKDVCIKQAKGTEDVAKAELEAHYKPSARATMKARVAKADADYSVAKEKCDDHIGNAKDVCVKDAKAAYVTAKENAKVAEAQAKAGTTANSSAAVAEARKDAAAETNEAKYKAAKERCDAMTGEGKDKCVADAKRMYGQS